MSETFFEARVKALSYQANLKISDASATGARLQFKFGEISPATRQSVLIIPFDETWEFSCPSIITEKNPDDIPKVLLIYALQQNAKNKRGFWALEYYRQSGNYVLEYMDNISGSLLTPHEFSEICWAVARAVDNFERMLRNL